MSDVPGGPARRQPPSTARALAPVAVVLLLLGVCVLLVWPIGNYPVDDEWAYARALATWMETGRLRILDWNPMTLVAHLGWGLAFAAPFGFSFTLLRLSTAVLAGLEVAAVVALVRRLGGTPGAALLAGAAVLLHPLHLFQSMQYATDVPVLAWTTLALLFYVRGLEAAGRRSWASLALGSLCAALAFGVRQPGALVAAALGLHLLLFRRDRAADPRTWLAAFAAPVVAAAAYLAWYHGVHGATGAYRASTETIHGYFLQPRAGRIAADLYAVAATLAFLLAPLLVATPWRDLRPRGARRWIVAGGIAALAIGGFTWVTLRYDLLFPYLRNKVTRFGFLSPNEFIVGTRDVLWSEAVAWALSVVLLVLALALGLRLLALRARGPLRLVALLFALQLLYVLGTLPIAFDRHLLILLPTGAVLLGSSLHSLRPAPALAAGALLVAYGVYGVLGAHDVHAISRTAAEAARDLVQDGVDPQLVDAGYAFTGWQVYERSQRERSRGLPARARPDDPWYVPALFPRVLSCYVVSLSPRLGPGPWLEGLAPWARAVATRPRLRSHGVVREYDYTTWWPPRQRRLFVLRDTRPPCRRAGVAGEPTR